MGIAVKRAYDPPSPDDGYRVLVDRLWPRGISKEEARLDEWLKELAPSNELRQWFHKNLSHRDEFRQRYLAELVGYEKTLRRLAHIARTGQLTLVYSSRNEDFNNATVLKEHLETLMSS
ncbi:MAG TPA: DUF488 family protein [Calditerricola sp.]